MAARNIITLFVLLSSIVNCAYSVPVIPADSKLESESQVNDADQLQMPSSRSEASLSRLIGEPDSDDDASGEQENELEQMGEGSNPFGTEVEGNNLRLSREDTEAMANGDDDDEQEPINGARMAQVEGARELLWSEGGEQDNVYGEPHGLDSNIENAKIQLTDTDQVQAAGHHHHHHHYVHGKLDMGAHTGKKGSFGWHDKHPVGGKGRR